MIPKARQGSTVVPIPKKSDLTDMNKYHGISLIRTALKVLMSIISVRLKNIFERKNLFSKMQAGFRAREECVTQAACFYEIVQRR